MTRLSELPNIGPQSAAWLESVGIETDEDLSALGAVEAYLMVKEAYPDRVSLNMLWGLQGVLLDIPWNELPPEIKEDLKREVEKAQRAGQT